jgi:hypothetical protein
MNRSRLSVIALATCGSLAVTTGALAAPTLEVTSTGKIGDPLVIRAGGGLTPRLSYRATFTESASARRPGRQCARTIDRPYRAGTSPTRVYVFRGRVPRTLACLQGDRRFVIPVKPGRYVVVVGHKTGKASWDPAAATLRKALRVTG